MLSNAVAFENNGIKCFFLLCFGLADELPNYNCLQVIIDLPHQSVGCAQN